MSTPQGDDDPRSRAPVAREFAWWWVWIALVLAAVTGATVGYLLWGTTTADHRDAFDTAWKSSAAILAILAAVISVERFRLSQREHHRQLQVDQFTRADAIARQITDLSAKASEQLGSDKAAVRIGGLTDLERLGQAHADLRQTVVDRVCAYLRAPYRPPNADTPPDPHADPGEQPAAPEQEELTAEETAARRLELDVRRTAQQILKRHLHWPEDADEPPPAFWADVDLDLRDALLVDFDLAGCRVAGADFRNARFHGDAQFTDVIFAEFAVFVAVAFSGQAVFSGAAFPEGAGFGQAAFSGGASFEDATFTSANFVAATFSDFAVFDGATIGHAGFNRAVFSGLVRFDEAVFPGEAWFNGAVFTDGVGFAGAAFADAATFRRAAFSKGAVFLDATFFGVADFADATFEFDAGGVELIGGARTLHFDHALVFDRARVAQPEAEHSFPPPWRVEPDPAAGDGSGRLVRLASKNKKK